MERNQKTGGWTAAVIVLTLLLPLFYVLSIGPAVWLIDRELISAESVMPLYMPLDFAAEMWPRAARPLVWYCELWYRLGGVTADQGTYLPIDANLPIDATLNATP